MTAPNFTPTRRSEAAGSGWAYVGDYPPGLILLAAEVLAEHADLDVQEVARRLRVAVAPKSIRKRVPRFCPQCGEPEPDATEATMWCERCGWTEER